MPRKNRKLRCSFCPRSEIKKLIQGPNGVAICGECIALAWDIVRPVARRAPRAA